MAVGLSLSESAIEVSCLINYTHNSVFSCGFSLSRKPILAIAPRRGKNRSRITTRSALSDGGGIVVDKEFEFKPSFDEYLKAMESVKIDRDNNNNNCSSSDSPRKKKIIKRIVREEENVNDGDATTVQERSRKRGFIKRSAFVDEIGLEKVKDKQNRTSTIVNRKKRDTSESNSYLDLERAAFKPLEYEDVIDKPRVSRLDMEERIQKLAKCLNGADIDMPEWKFSEMMRNGQIRFSDHSILRVVQILGKLGNWRRVLQVIEWIQSHERFKSHKIRYIYTAALDALGKAKRPVEALNVFRAMQEQIASYPDIVAYHCIAVTLGQAGHMKELFDVIDTMRSPPKQKFKTEFVEKWDPRLEPDVIVYNAVLNACVRRQKWEGAFWVLQQLNERGQQPSSTTYGLVMEVMLACGKYNLVHDFFKKVQKSYIPNALIYKVLVNTLWREGKTDEAIRAVEDMERRGIVGNAGLYYDLARCLCSAGRCNEALKQIDKICKVANKPLVVTYTGLIQACLDSGDIQNGAYVFNHMQRFCSPNLITCNIMLKAFVDHGKFEEAKQLFLRLLENGNFITREEDYKVSVIPDIYSFNTMLDACVAEQKWDELEFVYAQMLKYAHNFNAKRHLRPILNACRAGKEEILEVTWKHLVEAERVPPPPLITEMFCKRVEQGKYAAALSCLTNYASVESQLSSRKSWSKFFIENAHRFNEGTLDELLREASIIFSMSENIAIQHLMESCKEFLRTQRTSTHLEQIVV
ncbi:hypothetical protein BUALT_Bualt03G0012500 [Buddleja alternifolia]|uniref:Pentatricopeptide repeat-containing protein n=1 Tax=Buddleja alternifolia TaxID=168488 RepID=A0AAV6XYL7_9LAMI|nr:hypothetical protein BUALT_Bualt03G0012500 [Buddleja alternifolia]